MRTRLIRHGKTPGNALRRYIGRTDEPLSDEGRREAERLQKDETVRLVFVSPLLRARETAAILFPRARQHVLDNLRETDFGAFEGRSAEEMAEDAAYRAWVDGWCLGRCPGGESRADVQARALEAFSAGLRLAAEEGENEAVFVTHGGVIMAILEKLALPHRDYYDYAVSNLEGWQADCALEGGQIVLRGAKRFSLEIAVR